MPALGVPEIVRGRGPGDVTDVVGAEAPGERAAGARTRDTPRQIGVGDDRDLRAGGRRCLGQPRPLGLCEHVAGVVERASSTHNVAGGDRDSVGEVAVLEIELTLPEVRLGVPSLQIVIHGDPRIPLRQLVQRPVAAHPIRAVHRHLKMPGDVEHRGGPGCQRLGQVRFELRAFRQRMQGHSRSTSALHSLADEIEVIDLVAAVEAPPAESRLLRKDQRVQRVGLERVLLDLEPDEPQGVRRMVGIAKMHLARQRVACRIQRRADVIVSAVLPVAGARHPGGRSKLVSRRKPQWRENRGVAHAGGIEERRVWCRRWRAHVGRLRKEERRCACKHRDASKHRKEKGDRRHPRSTGAAGRSDAMRRPRAHEWVGVQRFGRMSCRNHKPTRRPRIILAIR